MSKINIVDARMGKGKTSWAIQHMNDDLINRYVYITPFLAEVKRVRENCHEKKFKEPINFGNGKQDNLHELLAHKSNIVSTHALFRMSTDVTRDLISMGDYVLILDEVMDVIEQLHLKKDDIPSMLGLELISVSDDGIVSWNESKMDYDGKYNDIKIMALNKTLILVSNKLLMWNFPVDVFSSFKEVYVMTYMFHGQVQRYYYDLFGVKYRYNTVINNNGIYELITLNDKSELAKYDDTKELRDLITIESNMKLNMIGSRDYSLSSTWFNKSENEVLIKILQKNIYNYFTNITRAKSKDILWTTFKSSKTNLQGKGYSRGFISCNLRATNEYGDRHYLAYCVNIFLNPIISKYFISRGVDIDEDIYALSEMLQWIWRSAIRNNQPISIYIPSERMRDLLSNYLILGNSTS